MASLTKSEGRLLRRLVSPIAQIQTHGVAIWRHDYFTVQACFGWYLMGALRLKSSFFDRYTYTQPTRTWVDLEDLNDTISSVADDQSLIIFALTMAHDQQTYLCFMFVPRGDVMPTRETLRGGPIPYHRHPDVDESEFEYEVIAGITSEEFRRIIKQFGERGADYVDAYISDDDVTFRGGPNYQAIVLTTESGACVVGGTYDFCMVTIRIYLFDRMVSFIEASEHCTTVWLLQSGGDSPDTVNFPLGELGNFMFYRNS
ncbi:uncharacterized protein LOC130783051 [Actinidia eriantha]|uniref:uncharacterized protein LOC130783051 n=1 Tax=Actinidia eriantha TaxID=165200 RepID=UPI00258372BD|nr:uncharacterized protein LOC130783051 [Actinidia eriantha]